MKHASHSNSFNRVVNVSFLIFIRFLILVYLTVFTVIIVGCGDSCGVCVEQVLNRSRDEVLKRSFPNLPPHPDEAAPAAASGQGRKDSMRCPAGYGKCLTSSGVSPA